MPRRSTRRDAMARAEARRRARYLAQGREPDEEEPADEAADEPSPGTATARPAGSFLQRLFPSPPPLPGKPNPLAGFTYQGRFRALFEALYLLRRHPLPWLTGGLIWATGRIFTDNSMVGILASLVSFTALIGAGWVGWWRPWLAGLAASIVGWIVFIGLAGALSVTGPVSTSPSPVASGSVAPSASAAPSASLGPSASPGPSTSPIPSASGAPGVADTPPPSASDVVVALAVQTAIQLALGTGAGWYGGYLRRRMVASTPPRRPQQRSRR